MSGKPVVDELKGEVAVKVSGSWEVMRYTMGAIREIKKHFGVASLEELVSGDRAWGEDDIVVLMGAGLRRGSKGLNTSYAEIEDMLLFREMGLYAEAVKEALEAAAGGGEDLGPSATKGDPDGKPFHGSGSPEGSDSDRDRD